MLASQQNFDPGTVSLMGRICDEAWELVQSTTYIPVSNVRGLRDDMAMRVMTAVAAGERDPARLKAIALDAVEA